MHKTRTRTDWWHESPTSYSVTASLQVDKDSQAFPVSCGKHHRVEIRHLKTHIHGLCIVQQVKAKFYHLIAI